MDVRPVWLVLVHISCAVAVFTLSQYSIRMSYSLPACGRMGADELVVRVWSVQLSITNTLSIQRRRPLSLAVEKL